VQAIKFVYFKKLLTRWQWPGERLVHSWTAWWAALPTGSCQGFHQRSTSSYFRPSTKVDERVKRLVVFLAEFKQLLLLLCINYLPLCSMTEYQLMALTSCEWRICWRFLHSHRLKGDDPITLTNRIPWPNYSNQSVGAKQLWVKHLLKVPTQQPSQRRWPNYSNQSDTMTQLYSNQSTGVEQLLVKNLLKFPTQ